MPAQAGITTPSSGTPGKIPTHAFLNISTNITRDGKFINTLRGHVAPVYQCAFSADSRLLVTASKDTTLKVWSMATHKLSNDLPGHADEVYAVDWAPDGKRVGSGGKDKAVRVWQN